MYQIGFTTATNKGVSILGSDPYPYVRARLSAPLEPEDNVGELGGAVVVGAGEELKNVLPRSDDFGGNHFLDAAHRLVGAAGGAPGPHVGAVDTDAQRHV